MGPERVLDALDDLLVRERAAIRGLDARAVEEISAQKEAFVAELSRAIQGREDLAARVRATTSKLRDNCVLLAHARDCLDAVLVSVAREMNVPYAAGARGRPSAHPPRRGLCVSVKG